MTRRIAAIVFSSIMLILELGSPVVAQMKPASVQAQAAMHTRVMALYSFSPHLLSDAQRDAKSKEMDAFWSEVKASRASALPLLREELRNPKDPAFFMDDGSELLLSLSQDKADLQLAADAMPRCDLADVQPNAYFSQVQMLTAKGANATQAALHILDDEHFRFYLPQHAMTVPQELALVYLLLPAPPDQWIESARARFAAEKSEMGRESLLTLFFYVQTPEGDAALESAAHNAALPEATRKKAVEYQNDVAAVLKSKHPITKSEAALREERRVRMASLSDESADDVQMLTAEVMLARKR